jgi:hypothetical protein
VAEHSKGPWTSDPEDEHSDGLAIYSGNDWIASAYWDVDRDQASVAVAHANARLIAAAPELLAACKAIVAWLDGDNEPDDLRDGFEVLAGHVEACRAAARLAEGATP